MVSREALIGNLLSRSSSPHSKKRSSVLEDRKEEMGYAGSPVKAPPNTRRRILPPTPQQISFSSTDESQW